MTERAKEVKEKCLQHRGEARKINTCYGVKAREKEMKRIIVNEE